MVQNLGAGYHPVWEDGDIEKIVRRAQAVAVPGYRLWTAVDYGLWLIVVVSLGATIYLHMSEIAILTLVALAIIFFTRSSEKRVNYEYAVQIIWEARVTIQNGNAPHGWDLVIEAIRVIRPNIAIMRLSNT